MDNKLNVEVIVGDITKLGEEVEAIVNAANESLLGGGGVDGRIHQAAGHKLYEECKKLNGCKPGEAKATKAYNLPQKYIIHTVGPRYLYDKNPRETLKNAYLNSLKLADELGIKTIAFPSISTGAFRYPVEKAAEVFAEVIKEYEPKLIEKVLMVIYGEEINKKIYEEAVYGIKL